MENQTYSLREAFIAVIWMAWVLVIGIMEALVHIVSANTYLVVEDDKWAVQFLRYKRQ